MQTLGKLLDILELKGKDRARDIHVGVDNEIKSSMACAREDVQGLNPGPVNNEKSVKRG